MDILSLAVAAKLATTPPDVVTDPPYLAIARDGTVVIKHGKRKRRYPRLKKIAKYTIKTLDIGLRLGSEVSQILYFATGGK